MAYKPLRALELAEQLANECSAAAADFPPHQKELADQLRRAANRMPLNLAEGATRVSLKDYRRFADTARASGEEVKLALRLGFAQHCVTRERFERIEALRDETARTLYGLLRYLDRRIANGEKTRTIP